MVEAVIENSYRFAFEYILDINEINPVFKNVLFPFSFIPLKSHQLIVVTLCSAVKKVNLA
jgi:hypothetical protein